MARPKGSLNKTSHSVRSNVLAVFDMIGGREAMAKWAKENPSEFYKLYGKGMPHEITGEEGGPISVVVKKFGLED